MKMRAVPVRVIPDEQLWQRIRSGDRDAFERLVERYQSLVCALAYSACGDFGRSEDFAQETFLAAWKRREALREPARIRAWLCGIVRNITANAVRRDVRRGGDPEALETVVEHASEEPDPASQTVSREEELRLWESLSRLPESYREPLVLFYREQRSVAEVAALLDLGEGAVRQRLSRGRSLLRDAMTARLESVLVRTGPTAVFTAGVLSAITLGSGPAAGAGMAAAAVAGKAATGIGKGGFLASGLGWLLGPAIGLLSTWFATQAVGWTSRSDREKAIVSRFARRIGIFCFVMSVGLAVSMGWASTRSDLSPLVLLGFAFLWVAVLLAAILRGDSRMRREVSRVREETDTGDLAYARRLECHGRRLDPRTSYESRWRFLGLPLVAFDCGSLDVGSHRSRAVKAWIAVGDMAISPLVAFGGVAVAPIALGGVSVGLLSLGGCAFGGLALGGIAAGWCALGPGALGWTAAAGGLAVARDFAVGGVVRAAEANTEVAQAWFGAQWFTAPAGFFFRHVFWVILASVVVPLVWMARGAWILRRAAR